jgi:tRNA threonylcarbamoyladenosine biosynthesis protein TsaE
VEERSIITRTAEETSAVGEAIGAAIKDGGIVCLYGDLGSGKTTFTQGLAKALGLKKHVNSPTFLVIRKYESRIPTSPRLRGASKNQESRRDFYHIDLYRLESEKEMVDIGIGEILEDPRNIVVIEWSEKLGTLLPKKRIDIRFTYVADERRKIETHDYR